ncbi:hypothetical protein PRK78_004640 [Emydomyces testavorans]|uniref:Zn(2)-C6 fungal-type domain-containing protein n=1 Tax=Emydomyces testavorans TaxID=2070801 RepID=A0AAF0IJY9_9EURO|nr:hypothetical protein PRK78_004640 [Emydomyces testavorans]
MAEANHCTLKKRRLACDRCNSLKLRCSKVAGSEICVRCTRASAACIFSPSMRGLRPQAKERDLQSSNGGNTSISQISSHQATNDLVEFNGFHEMSSQIRQHQSNRDPVSYPQGNSIHSNTNTEVDSDCAARDVLIQRPNLDLENHEFERLNANGVPATFSGQEAVPTQLLSEYNLQGVEWLDEFDFGNLTPSIVPMPETNVASSQHQTSDSQHDGRFIPTATKDLAYQLATLFLTLEDHWTSMPPLSIHDDKEAYDRVLASAAAGSSTGRGTLFSIVKTFELTQTLIDLYPLVLKKVFSTRSSTTSENAISIDSIDQASVLQLLACHHRVLDMWELVFRHLQKSVEKGKCGGTAAGSPSPCERLRIGSFVPATKVPMEVILAIEFQRLLLDCAHDLDTRISSLSVIDVPEISKPDRIPQQEEWNKCNFRAYKTMTTAAVSRSSLVHQNASSVHLLMQRASKIA